MGESPETIVTEVGTPNPDMEADIASGSPVEPDPTHHQADSQPEPLAVDGDELEVESSSLPVDGRGSKTAEIWEKRRRGELPPRRPRSPGRPKGSKTKKKPKPLSEVNVLLREGEIPDTEIFDQVQSFVREAAELLGGEEVLDAGVKAILRGSRSAYATMLILDKQISVIGLNPKKSKDLSMLTQRSFAALAQFERLMRVLGLGKPGKSKGKTLEEAMANAASEVEE